MAQDGLPTQADGLWFGLCTAVYDDDEERADAYVRVCKFDPVDPDWACTALWKPRAKNAHSDLLRDVHRIGYGTPGGLEVDAEYPSVLGFIALSVAAWARSCAGAGAAVARQRRQLVVGFDGGDMVHVGEFDGASFRRPREKFVSVS